MISEPWQLVGIDGHPPSLDDLRTALEDLGAVVDELADNGADTERIRRSALAGTSTQALRRAAETCRRAKKRRQQKRRQEVQAVCRATGLRANVFDSAHGLATVEYRVSVELDSLFEWHGAVQKLEAALHSNQRADETYLFVPLRHNRPVPGQAMKLIFSLWSDPNPDGLDKLPDPHSSELARHIRQSPASTPAALRNLLPTSGAANPRQDTKCHRGTRFAVGSSMREAPRTTRQPGRRWIALNRA